MEGYEDGYRDLMEKGGTYNVSVALNDGGKWYLRCVGCVVGSFVGGFIEMEVV